MPPVHPYSPSARAPRPLFWITLLFLFLALLALLHFSRSSLPKAIEVHTEGFPTIGYLKAPVHAVLFTEPKCVNCKAFHETIFPVIKKEFIDTHKILYTVIPVSFLPGSLPAAVALLCVYNSNPSYPNHGLFFSYLDYMYTHQPSETTDWATDDTLLDFATHTSPAIHLDSLKQCIDFETYRIEIEKNTKYGQEIMGGTISTPSLCVNGIQVELLSVEGVRDLLQKVLAEEGIH